MLLLFVGCLTSQLHASLSQGLICLHNSACCHTEIEDADSTCYLAQSQYTDSGPTSPTADPTIPEARQCSPLSSNNRVSGMAGHGHTPTGWRCGGGHLTTRPTRRWMLTTINLPSGLAPHSHPTPWMLTKTGASLTPHTMDADQDWRLTHTPHHGC